MNLPELSVVIPTYNEEKGIKRSLEQVVGFLDEQDCSYEVLVADDGSTDGTASVVNDFIKGKERVRLLELPHRGKGATVRDGMLAAKGKYILFTDADLATPIEELKRLLNWVVEQGYDLAIGSREGLGARRENEPFYRHLMGRVFNFVVKLFVLRGIEDTQCGFKLFKAAAAKDIFKRLQLYGAESPEISVPKVTAFDVEVLFVALKLGYKIKEVPVAWRHVKTTRVNPLRDSWLMFWDVIKVRLNDLRGLYSV